MCGIFGVTFKEDRKDLGTILSNGAQRLSYRGYDSAGIATIKNKKITVRKDAGSVQEIRKKYNFDELEGHKGISQLRWATFGKPSKKNAQPHFDTDKYLIGALNGNILNSHNLNKKYQKEGIIIRSENDGETCVHAIKKYYKKTKDMKKAIVQAMKVLEGDYAVTVSSPDDNVLWVVKKGSSLALGMGEDFTAFSSDLPSLLPLTKKILRINDWEIAKLTPDKIELFDGKTGKKINRKPYIFKGDREKAKKGKYDHFFIKEINEQKARALELVKYYSQSDELKKLKKLWKTAGNIYLAGCGTSFNACHLGAYYINKHTDKNAIPVLTNNLEELYFDNLQKNDLVFLVSQSGETKDVVNLMRKCEKKKIPTVGVVNVIGSTISNDADLVLPILAGYEVSVPATKTFTNQCILFLVISKYLSGKKVNTKSIEKAIDFAFRPSMTKKCKEIAKILVKNPEFYYLGYGQTLPIAYEGALKIKEVTYLHCEAINSAEYKHGPLSSVHKGYPVTFISNKKVSKKMQNQVHEVDCRLGNPIIISPPDKNMKNMAYKYIQLPDLEDDYSAIAANTALQLIAYYTSIAMKLDPDRPRNLSKTITVD
jgi:glucosamine--fructose-6-phosphate aminotransferase (isomerizing)